MDNNSHAELPPAQLLVASDYPTFIFFNILLVTLGKQVYAVLVQNWNTSKQKISEKVTEKNVTDNVNHNMNKINIPARWSLLKKQIRSGQVI